MRCEWGSVLIQKAAPEWSVERGSELQLRHDRPARGCGLSAPEVPQEATESVTFGGGRMNNPGRYLTLLPPINGADAVSGSPYFPENPGLPAHMWDSSVGLE